MQKEEKQPRAEYAVGCPARHAADRVRAPRSQPRRQTHGDDKGKRPKQPGFEGLLASRPRIRTARLAARHWCCRFRLRGCLFFECGVEGDRGRLEVDALGELARLGRAGFPLHAAVLPLDGQGPVVADVVQSADDFLEVDPAPAE